MRTEEEICKICSFDELMDWYLEEMEFYIRLGLTSAQMLDRMYGINYPLPFFSLLMEGCIEQGIDAARGGALYNNASLNMCGLANGGGLSCGLEEAGI